MPCAQLAKLTGCAYVTHLFDATLDEFIVAHRDHGRRQHQARQQLQARGDNKSASCVHHARLSSPQLLYLFLFLLQFLMLPSWSSCRGTWHESCRCRDARCETRHSTRRCTSAPRRRLRLFAAHARQQSEQQSDVSETCRRERCRRRRRAAPLPSFMIKSRQARQTCDARYVPCKRAPRTNDSRRDHKCARQRDAHNVRTPNVGAIDHGHDMCASSGIAAHVRTRKRKRRQHRRRASRAPMHSEPATMVAASR